MRVAFLSDVVAKDLLEDLISAGPRVQVVEGLDDIEEMKGITKVMFIPEELLAMMVLEIPMLSRRQLSPEASIGSTGGEALRGRCHILDNRGS